MSESDKRAAPDGERPSSPTLDGRELRPAAERKPGEGLGGLGGTGGLGGAATTSATTEGAMESLLHDVPLEVSVELGRVRLPLGELAARLTPGSVIALDKLSGALLDVRVQSRLIARAEAVAIGERCGIRILELVGGHDS
jgi:flagellar motor switch protein FliN